MHFQDHQSQSRKDHKMSAGEAARVGMTVNSLGVHGGDVLMDSAEKYQQISAPPSAELTDTVRICLLDVQVA